MKFFCFLLFLISLSAIKGNAVIECHYLLNYFDYIGQIYTCLVQNDPSITFPTDTQVFSVNGSHENGQDNDKVQGFYTSRRNIQHFPQGLEKIFNNLKVFVIMKTGLKQIQRSDFKQLPKLELFWGSDNNIEVIADGLFDCNPQMRYIALDGNKISHIHPDVFDRLTGLVRLQLESNRCINRNVVEDKTALKEIIHEIKTNCLSPDATITKKILDSCEPESCEFALQTCKAELKYSIANVTEEIQKMRKELKKDIEKEFSDNLETIVSACESSRAIIDTQRIESIEKTLENFSHQVSSALLNIIEKINDLKVTAAN